MSPEQLLGHLERVRETGRGQWIACCPAHDDTSPSLSIKETSEGILLLHCFTGCDTAAIMAAVGLTLADLYPEPLGHHSGPVTASKRRRYGQALDALQVLSHESLVAVLAAETVAAGEALTDDDLARLLLAAERIRQTHALAGRPLPRDLGVTS